MGWVPRSGLARDVCGRQVAAGGLVRRPFVVFVTLAVAIRCRMHRGLTVPLPKIICGLSIELGGALTLNKKEDIVCQIF